MKRKYCLMLLVILCTFSGCAKDGIDAVGADNAGNQSAYPGDKPIWSAYDNAPDEAYVKKTWISQVKSPYGMCASEDYMYVVSQEGGCVFQYDLSGRFIRKIGSLGNGQGKLNKPVNITFYDGMIYVADEQDGYIQVFDEAGKSRKMYRIEEFSLGGLSVIDLEVNSTGIYVSMNGTVAHEYPIFHLSFQGKLTQIDSNKMGIFTRNGEEQLLFVQAYEPIATEKETGYETGESYMGNIENDTFTFQNYFPDKFHPTSMEVFQDELYMYSYSSNAIYKFKSDGTYLETMYREKPTAENQGMFYFTMDKQGNMYIADRGKNLVYKISKEE